MKSLESLEFAVPVRPSASAVSGGGRNLSNSSSKVTQNELSMSEVQSLNIESILLTGG